MIAALITFLGSSAGGAILGFVMDWMAENRQATREKNEYNYKTRMAELEAIDAHTKQLDITLPTTLKPVKRMFQLGSWKYETTTFRLYPTNIPSARARVIAASVGMLVITYCAVLFIFAIDPNWVIYTFQPDEEPIKYNILFLFQWEYRRNTPFVLNTGGVAYLMAHPLIFIISTAIVGTARKLGK